MNRPDLSAIRTLITLDCQGERHKIVVWENGQVRALNHRPEETLFELSRDLASLSPEYPCMDAIRALRAQGERGTLPPELSHEVKMAEERRLARRNRLRKIDPYTLPWHERMAADYVGPCLRQATGEFSAYYRSWADGRYRGTVEYPALSFVVGAQAEVRRLLGKEKSSKGLKVVDLQVSGAVPLHWLPRVWKRGIAVLGDHPSESPVFILDARNYAQDATTFRVLALRAAPTGVKIQAWYGILSPASQGFIGVQLHDGLSSDQRNTWAQRQSPGHRWRIQWTRRVAAEGRRSSW